MPRDYKGRAAPRRQRTASGWVFFFAGFALGLFVAGLAWLKLSPPGPVERQAAAPAPSASPEPAAEEGGRAPKPRFDFYTLLPAQEVVVPAEEMDEPQPPPSPDTPADRKPSGSYLLQMGAFRKYDDADRLKASLALLGIEARIQRVSIDDKESFHRVRSGPHTRAEANALHARLKANDIPSLVLKVSE